MSVVPPSPRSEMASRDAGGHSHKSEGPADTDSSDELWSSKSLNLLWLPRRDNWHNPSLHSVATEALREADRQPAAPQTPDRKGKVCRVFWRVDPTFGAWVVRAIRRADQARADLPGVSDAFYAIRTYLESRHPGCWADVERVASAGPVRVVEIPVELAGMVRIGLFERWDGFEKWAASLPATDSPPPVPPTVAIPATRPPQRKRPRTPEKSGPTMFD